MAIHEFQPQRYYSTMGTFEPVLRIADGDTVRTTTVDASGFDAAREQVTPPGNPMTGPFWVEGAEPGDTVALELESIVPNRAYGWSGSMVAANIVDPEYVPRLPWPPAGERRRAEWRVDATANTATLLMPEAGLGELTLQLAPMLGCFGVAPGGGQAISTATSAEHGGNMDYRGWVAGVTAYFPVAVPGALIFVGDGHALQGDGEIAGTGIEISMDVRFTVRLLRGKTITWPRGENADYIFTIGNARPLDQCVQHATSEMLRWLIEDYGLEPIGASTLLGQCVEYDLANIYDPAYTMVCKLPKRFLTELRIEN